MSTSDHALPRSGSTILRWLLCFTLFGLSLALTGFGIRRHLPFPDVPVVRAKLDWLEKHGDAFDIVFIGTSRIEQQIIPEIFDRTSAELGHPVHSFNAGIAAMNPPEDAYVLEQILQRPHQRLRWVLLEIRPVKLGFNPVLAGTGRMDYWHDATRMELLTQWTAREMQSAWQDHTASASERLQRFGGIFLDWGMSLKSFFTREVNFGRGVEWTTARYGAHRKASRYDGGGAAGDGWSVPPGNQKMEGDELAAYQKAFAERHDANRTSFTDDLSEAALRHIVDLLRRNGIQPIFVVPPALADTQFLPASLLPTVPLLDFSDTIRYAPLYAVEHHKDGVHLNVAGAEIFSKELAISFVENARPAP